MVWFVKAVGSSPTLQKRGMCARQPCRKSNVRSPILQKRRMHPTSLSTLQSRGMYHRPRWSGHVEARMKVFGSITVTTERMNRRNMPDKVKHQKRATQNAELTQSPPPHTSSINEGEPPPPPPPSLPKRLSPKSRYRLHTFSACFAAIFATASLDSFVGLGMGTRT